MKTNPTLEKDGAGAIRAGRDHHRAVRLRRGVNGLLDGGRVERAAVALRAEALDVESAGYDGSGESKDEGREFHSPHE